MAKRILFIAILAMASAGSAGAGTLAGGNWTATGCGSEPPAASLDLGSVDDYNRSVQVAKKWQQQANAYAACVVAEAPK